MSAASDLTFPTIDVPDSPERRQSTQLRAFLEMGLAEVHGDSQTEPSRPCTAADSEASTAPSVPADSQSTVFNIPRRGSRSASRAAQLLLPLGASPLGVSTPHFRKPEPSQSSRNLTLLDLSDSARARSSVLAPPRSQTPMPPIPPLYTSVLPKGPPLRVTRSSSIHKLGSQGVAVTHRPPMPAPSFAVSGAASGIGNEPTTPPTESPLKSPTTPRALQPKSPAAVPVVAPKRSTRRPEGFIPRPPNAWILYRSEQIRNLKKDPELCRKLQSDISKIIGAMWRGESEDVKLWYSREAGVKKLEHAQQYPGYSFAPVRKDRPKAANPLSNNEHPPHSVVEESDRLVPRPSTAPTPARAPRKRPRAATTTERYVPQPPQTPYDPSASNSSYDHHSADFLDKYALQFGRGAADSLATSYGDTFLHEDGLDELVASFDESWIPQASTSYQEGDHQPGSQPCPWDTAPYGFHTDHQQPLSAPAVMGYFDFSTTATSNYGLSVPGTSFHGEYTTRVDNGASSQGSHSPPDRDPLSLSPHQRTTYITTYFPRSTFPVTHFDSPRGVGPTDTSMLDTDESDMQEYLAYREMEEKLGADRSRARPEPSGYEVPMREAISYSFPQGS